jgi:hypothetical protein
VAAELVILLYNSEVPSIKEISTSTQLFTEIFDIANDLVILNSGTVDLVLEINTINFGLLAEEEQDAVIYAYAALLNALNFPIQIVIQSQTKDVTNYLDHLAEAELETTAPRKKAQISRYRNFVNELVHEGNVLDKKFYVVVAANNLDLGMVSAKTFLPWQKEEIDLSKLDKNEIYEKAAAWLEPKRDQLIDGFARLGLTAKQLTTQELVKLYYLNYNFNEAEGVIVGETRDYTVPLVTAQTMT